MHPNGRLKRRNIDIFATQATSSRVLVFRVTTRMHCYTTFPKSMAKYRDDLRWYNCEHRNKKSSDLWVPRRALAFFIFFALVQASAVIVEGCREAGVTDGDQVSSIIAKWKAWKLLEVRPKSKMLLHS